MSSYQSAKLGYKLDGRSGNAVVCLGCGHIEYFVDSVDNLLMQSGVMEVTVDSEAPYR